MSFYILATQRPWNRDLFEEYRPQLTGQWTLATSLRELDQVLSVGEEPRYIFFLHWSDWVPRRITQAHECVGFHMTDLPYGRGGSPLQNLIVRGIKETMLTAFRYDEGLDSGPVYAKCRLDISEGSAGKIYLRASRLSLELIRGIIESEVRPSSQEGEVVSFSRRTPEESLITSDLGDLRALHDHIRMLDAEGYPHAFLEAAGFRIEFTNSKPGDACLEAQVKVFPMGTEEET